ncbi:MULTISPECIES: hypothetical protein [unclassified Flavobacterium]|jgi:hypothetical protein|uniref:hypothetical protein n=1 Tax=unclassified Flavobacterium TaxID=196869 RepID=UPI00129226E5|nr:MULTISPECIES: hypothetical protein [unclassified Flavobacterium]MQP53277.1 hypothetical protein [Flavobacterium sp. LMO9]MQP63288.1 hypothetical protein [Flavobacterium sp. LMO6]
MVLLFFLLIVAIIIIYKLNDKVEDDKVIKSNYSWKEEILSLKESIQNLESRENELLQKNMIDEISRNKEKIKEYRNKIIKLDTYIYNNEKYLKEKGRI